MAYWVLFFLLSIPFVGSYSVVDTLPGFQGRLPFQLETGYVGIGESEDVQLFYYFIKSERNPKEDPVMVWMTGGPGCSSLSGLAFEIGPVRFEVVEYNGTTPTLLLSPDSWTKVASIIFLDQPAGTGFSYARTPLALQSSDSKTPLQIDQFIRKWLQKHPEFLSNPLYVGGDSYSGKTVPPIALHISNGNEQGMKPWINLQGYVLGNPITDERADSNAGIPYAHGMGLISDELYESLVNSCGGEYQIVNPGNVECSKAIDGYWECIKDLNLAIISDDVCDSDLSNTGSLCKTYYGTLVHYWANDESVREALRIRKGSVGRWNRCNKYVIPYEYDIPSSLPYHAKLSAKGYRSLVYSGDHDLIAPFVGTQAWIRALNYSIVDDWRPWMINNQVKGYTRTYANRMTFATIKGGGHTAEYMPTPYYFMFRRWIDGEPL